MNKEIYDIYDVAIMTPVVDRLMTGYNHQSRCSGCHKKIHKDVLRFSQNVFAIQMSKNVHICARCILLMAKKIELLHSEDQQKAFEEWDKRLLMEAL